MKYAKALVVFAIGFVVGVMFTYYSCSKRETKMMENLGAACSVILLHNTKCADYSIYEDIECVHEDFDNLGQRNLLPIDSLESWSLYQPSPGYLKEKRPFVYR